MTWIEIGQDHLKAAKLLLIGRHSRSAISRAYYAAHAVLAERLIQHGWRPAEGRETPPHHRQGYLARQHLGNEKVGTLVVKLYTRRLAADYQRGVTIDDAVARQALRDVSQVFVRLGIPEVTP
jgi:uncharacterized protein (UPF0332 family)